jgi:hypothetical protein
VTAAAAVVDGERRRLPARVLDAPLRGFREGDKVAVLYNGSGRCALAEPVNIGTIRGVLTALRRGLLHRFLVDDSEARERVFAQIARHLRRDDRTRLKDAFERENLRA